MTTQDRLAKAKECILGKYKDRDEVEANLMESFRGLSKDQLNLRFKEAVLERSDKLSKEKESKGETL